MIVESNVKPTEITDATFEKEVVQSSLPVLVDFWAPWCQPCRMVGPVVEELAEEYAGKVYVVKVNTDEHPANASRLGIRGIPTLLIFQGGKETQRIIGFKPKADIRKLLDAALAAGH